MPTKRPFSATVATPVPARTANRERVILEDLATNYLPTQMENRIAAFLEARLSADVRAALGDPEAILRHVVDHAKEDGVDLEIDKHIEAVKQVCREFGGGTSPTIRPEFLKSEATHAKQKIVQYWTGTMDLAWEAWGYPDGGIVLANKTLKPGDSSLQRRWLDATKRRREALLHTIGLDMPELDKVLMEFTSKLSASVTMNNEKPISRDLVLFRPHAEHVLLRPNTGAKYKSGRMPVDSKTPPPPSVRP